jgi:ribose transport system substrate-binding protein
LTVIFLAANVVFVPAAPCRGRREEETVYASLGGKVVARRRRVTGVVAALSAVALIVAGCGGSDSSTTTSASTAAPAGTTASTTDAGGPAATAVQQAEAELAKISGPDGQFGSPPTSAPKPASGKTVWIVSVGQSVPAIAKVVSTIESISKDLGWKTRVWDGKLQPNQQLAGMRAAVEAKADAIINYGTDCPTIQVGLQAAKAAKIPVVGIESFDCDVVKPGAPSLFTWVVTYEQGDLTQFLTTLGGYQAAWAIAHGKGESKVVHFRETDVRTLLTLADAFTEAMKACSTCEIVDTVEFTGADYGPKLQQKTQQALVQHPETDSVSAGADSTITGGVGAGIRSSQHKPPAIGWECDASVMPLLKSGIEGACFDFVSEWEGYAAVDAVIRLFAGEKPTTQTGIGIRLVDKEHNLDGYVPGKGPVDYAAIYRKAWGLG